MLESQHLVRLPEDVVSIEQPLELLGGQRHHLLLHESRPAELLPPLDHLVPDREVVFIKPLFGMSLKDREKTARQALSRRISGRNVPAR